MTPLLTRIRMGDGIDIWVGLPLEEIEEKVTEALSNGVMLTITSPTEGPFVINPFQVVYIQALPDPQPDVDSPTGTQIHSTPLV